jgi:hypothetical protein
VHIDDLELVAHDNAAHLTRRSERLLAAATEGPMRSWSRAGALLLMLLAVWLLIGSWVLSLPLTAVADSTSTRDEGFAVVLGLAALRLLVAGRSPVATGVALLGGVLLVSAGLLAAHGSTRSADNEVICGVVALLCGLATLDRRRAGARAGRP